eukprot:TRINITY_DN3077_c0_g1_i1.p1 TRINITY_DN3077_c0_g1~~TRINITY_DN3077_c0_g1_i1.p1  ORF type:complete len:974 (-),score=379.97 TRINITY_DN3077_c0_g1_i1:61-2982(-)
MVNSTLSSNLTSKITSETSNLSSKKDFEEKNRETSTEKTVEKTKKIEEKKHQSKEEKIESIIQFVFKVSTDKENAKDSHYLRLLEGEINQRSENERHLNENDVDSILIEVLTQMSGTEILKYLNRSYQNISTVRTKEGNSFNELLEGCERSIVSQTGLTIQDEPLILMEMIENQHYSFPLDNNLFSSVLSTFEEDLQPFLSQIFTQILQKLGATREMIDLNVSSSLSILNSISSFPIFSKSLSNSKDFETEGNGRFLQMNSLLSPLFIHSFESNDVSNRFLNPTKLTQSHVVESYLVVRREFNYLQNNAFQIIKNLIKSDEKMKNNCLNWFGRVISGNKMRTKSQFEVSQCSTNGFLVNLSTVLLKFCGPFINSSEENTFNKIDSRYLYLNTRMKTDEEESKFSISLEDFNKYLKELREESGSTSFSFITEVFFLTLHSLHIGTIQVISQYNSFIQNVAKMQQKKKEMERNVNQMNGPQRDLMLSILKNHELSLEKMYTTKLTLDSQLMDGNFLDSMLQFYVFVGNWLLFLKGNGEESVSVAFSTLPEFILEDLIDFVSFGLRYCPEKLNVVMMANLLEIIIPMIGSSESIKNHWLRSRLVQVIYEMLPQEENGSQTTQFLSLFTNNRIGKGQLVPALFQLYVNIESTGRNHQFYEKFEVRRRIGIILKQLREYEMHQLTIKKQSESPLFVRFINLLLNDCQYLLDEMLVRLTEIKETESAMEDQAGWMALDETVRNDRWEKLQQNSNTVKSFCVLANQNIDLFNFLSFHTKKPFMVKELVDRIAQMLNYFINHLTGSKSLDLKVKDPSRFFFDPRYLLRKLIEIYLNFAEFDEFVQEVVNDGRSFGMQKFKQIIVTLRKNHLLPEENIIQFANFVDRIERISKEIDKEQEDLDDIPDEYLDPLFGTLMRDPVILPGSNTTMDRQWIIKHLLNSSTDPFNRLPLSSDMLIPNDKLREEIEGWIVSKKTKKTQV